MDSHSDSARDLNLLATKPDSEDSLSAEDWETMKKRTFELLENGETEIELYEQFKKKVLILGDTGNGKTVFTQWVAGDNTKLISREVGEGTEEYIIEDINEKGRSIITSDTIYPQLVVDTETNVAYYDCPGFNDTGDVSNEIATTCFIRKIVNHAESVKLIFAINYPSVRKGVDRHSFMKLVKHVANFIRNIEKFQNSIALVVTKVDNPTVKKGGHYALIDNDKIIATVANFLTEVQQDLEMKLRDGSSNDRQLHEIAVKFISILLVRDKEQYARIGIFRRPNEEGLLSEISLLLSEKLHIRRLIHEKLVYSEKEYDDFGYTLSEKCKNKILHLVEDINTSVWFSLTRIKEEVKEYYTKTGTVILSIIKNEDLQEVAELSTSLKDGCHSILSLVEDIKSMRNPEDLALKINAVVSNLSIDISKNDLLDIKNKGKYFNFLQLVSDWQLSTRPWYELIREVSMHLLSVRKMLQGEIDVVMRDICRQIESDFHQVAKVLQDQFVEKTKLLDMEEAFELLTKYHDAMLKMTEKTENAKNISELLLIVHDVTRDMNINFPEQKAQNTIQKEKNLICLKAFGETEVNIVLSALVNPFENVVKYLNESMIWYKFLDGLYATFSEYEMQKNRSKYNVLDIEDWGKPDKPQGIVVTKSNFARFLRNIARCNIVEYEDGVQNIALTESRLDELNQLLNLALKHRIDVEYSQPSIIIRADYISIKEIAAHLKYNSVDGHTLLDSFKSGVYKYLVIFALRKVFIDEDISLPGTELRIISPIWEIIGTRNIRLDGADGKPHFPTEAEVGDKYGNNGEHGTPGLPGKPGGNFFGIGEFFVNGANLTVTINGGSGGPGQHGGNGGEGKQGEDVGDLTNDDMPKRGEDRITRVKGYRCEEIQKWSNPNLFLYLMRLFRFTDVFGFIDMFQFTEEIVFYNIFGSPGQDGGNGGHGGKGGRGGNPGNVLIFDLKEDSKIKICKEKGKDGIDGRGGKGGSGGMNGQNKLAVLNGVMIRGWANQIAQHSGIASTGYTGTSGLNSVGIKVPEPSITISEPLEIVNEYKMYAKQNPISPFKKDFLLNFIALLEDINEIKDYSF